jgi:hypothetical protein
VVGEGEIALVRLQLVDEDAGIERDPAMNPEEGAQATGRAGLSAPPKWAKRSKRL